jgi:hypothetical protein
VKQRTNQERKEGRKEGRKKENRKAVDMQEAAERRNYRKRRRREGCRQNGNWQGKERERKRTISN